MAKSILSTGQLVIKARPDEDDVVVRQKRGNPSTVYVQHTISAPDQFLYRTRAAADLQARGRIHDSKGSRLCLVV
jgi:hypothetical protein